MTVLRHEVRIHAPHETVWAAVAGDLTAVRHYNRMVISARLTTAQRDGIGATRRCELRPKGFVEERVWEWTPDQSVGLEVTASEWPIVFMKWKTNMRPDGDSTVVSQEMSYELKFGALGRVMDALVMRRKLDAGLREVFESLKNYAEKGTIADTTASSTHGR